MIPEIQSNFSGHLSMQLIKEKKKAISNIIRKPLINTLLKYDIDSIDATNFDLSIFPGFTYSEYLVNKNTSEAFAVTREVTRVRWKYLDKCGKRNSIFPSIFTVGAGNKREVTYENFDSLTSRPVHMPKFPAELQSASWIESITDSIKRRKINQPIYYL